MTEKINPAEQLGATGTPSGTTFLRGDNTWSTPPGGGSTTPTASTNAEWDANVNMNANTFIGASNPVSTGGTITMTIASPQYQYFTGSTPATVLLPTTGVVAGQQYFLFNKSSANIALQSSTGAAITTLNNTIQNCIATAVLNTPTAAAHWFVQVFQTTGAVITFPNSSGILLFSGGSLGIPSSGTLTNCTGTPTLTLTNCTGLPLGGLLAAAYNTVPTVSTLAEFDANKNLSANNLIEGFATQAASSTTLVLTIASAQIQVITTSGVQTQLITLPTTSVPAGYDIMVINQSVANVTVQSSGANTVAVLPGGASAVLTAVIVTPTTAANWNVQYYRLEPPGLASTVTAAGTTTLTSASCLYQVFTGSSTQTVLLPTTGVPAGAQYWIINNSTAAVTVQSSGANTILVLAGNTDGLFTAMVAAPTTAANWEGQYFGASVASGVALNFTGTTGTTMTFPTTSATIARTDAANTFTGVQTMTSPSFTTPVLGTPSSGTIANPVTVNVNSLTGAATMSSLTAISTTTSVKVVTLSVPTAAIAAGTTFKVKAFGTQSTATSGTVTWRISAGTANTSADTTILTGTLAVPATLGSPTCIDGLLTIRTTGAPGTSIANAVTFNGATPAVTTTTATVSVTTTTTLFVSLYAAISAGTHNMQNAFISYAEA